MLQQSSGGGLIQYARKIKNGAAIAAPGGSSALEWERHSQINCRAQRLAAFVGVKCVAFDSMVLDLCRLESNASCLMF